MGDAKDTSSYKNGGEVHSSDDDGWDTVGDNPTGRKRKSSSRQRRKKSRKLFGGTIWGKGEDNS